MHNTNLIDFKIYIILNFIPNRLCIEKCEATNVIYQKSLNLSLSKIKFERVLLRNNRKCNTEYAKKIE